MAGCLNKKRESFWKNSSFFFFALLIFSLLIFLFFLNIVDIAGPALAKIWEADPADSDREIQNLIDGAAPGDTILVPGGTYYVETDINLKEGITFAGKEEDLGKVVISGNPKRRIIQPASNTCIKNFIIQDGNVAINCREGTTNITIEHNLILNNLYGITSLSDDVKILSNTIVHNLIRGIIVRIDPNVTRDLNRPILYGQGNIIGFNGCDLEIYQNVDQDSSKEPFLDLGVISLSYNNIFNKVYQFLVSSDHNDGTGITQLAVFGPGNFSANPYFKAPGIGSGTAPDRGDYHLLSYSPCIDRGDPDSDYSNEPQPNGGRVNLGFYGNTPEAALSIDSDDDGLFDCQEGAQDRDKDTVADWQDDDTVVIPLPGGNETITLHVTVLRQDPPYTGTGDDPARAAFKDAQVLFPPGLDFDLPDGYFPYGIVKFRVPNLDEGAIITLTMHLPENFKAIGKSSYLALSSESSRSSEPSKSSWESLPFEFDPSEKTITVTIEDGQKGDRDVANKGVIEHTAGLVIPETISWKNPGKCFISLLESSAFKGTYFPFGKSCQILKSDPISRSNQIPGSYYILKSYQMKSCTILPYRSKDMVLPACFFTFTFTFTFIFLMILFYMPRLKKIKKVEKVRFSASAVLSTISPSTNSLSTNSPHILFFGLFLFLGILFFSWLFFPSPGWAQLKQSIEIASSPHPVGSGARALGMAGAYIGSADDATAASWNPAGLKHLVNPEISLVGAYSLRSERLDFDKSPEASGTYRLDDWNVNYLSVTYPVRRFKKNFFLSLNYQHLYDFSKKLSSYHWHSFSERPSWDMNYQADCEQSGGLRALSPALAVMVTPRLTLGMAANIWSDKLFANEWVAKYHTDGQGTIDKVPVVSHADSCEKYRFSGLNFNLGLLWDIGEVFTLGAVYKTPFTADLEHTSTLYHIEKYPQNSLPDKYTYESKKEKEELSMPRSYGLGLAYHPFDSSGDLLVIDLDIYRTEWGDYELIKKDGSRISPITGYSKSEVTVKPTWQVRLGAEYAFVTERRRIIPTIRGGAFYDPEPAPDKPDDFYGVSLGFGLTFREKNEASSRRKKRKERQYSMSIDMAYQYRRGKQKEGEIIQGENSQADVDHHLVYSSVIYYF